MAKTVSYLAFKGDCAEAFGFYKDCFGGELTINKVGGTPAAEHMPPETHDYVMHAELLNGGIDLMGSDMSDADIERGNGFSIAIIADGIDELRTYFAALAQGGTVGHELTEEYFGTYGDLTDKYGVRWMFQADAKPQVA